MPRPTRRRILAGSALAAYAAVAHGPIAHADDTPLSRRDAPGRDHNSGRPAPNIVLIDADDLGYGEIGPYGQKIIATPNLDALAKESLVFTDAYSSGTVCAPSRCSLYTGLHNGHARVRVNPGLGIGGIDLFDQDVTFAEVLRARGYQTGLFGKWGFGPEQGDQPSHPNARGFQEFYGYITHGHAHQYYPSYLWRDDAKEDIPENADGAQGVFAPDRFRDLAVDFIRRHRDAPFLLVVTPNLPHAPSDAPDLGAYADEDWPEADKGHAAQVTRLDAHIGDIVAELKAQRLEHDTYVFVTSDNGPHVEGGVNPDRFNANGPLSGYKRNLFDGGIRVPLLVWAPGHVTPGVTAFVTQQTDLLPTFAELAETAWPSDLDGRSLAPLLGGRSASGQDHLYWFRRDNGNQPKPQAVDSGRLRNASEAVRQGGYKAIRWAPGTDHKVPRDEWTLELYDVSADIGERNDLAPLLPSLARRLGEIMTDSWMDVYPRVDYGASAYVPRAVPKGSPATATVTISNGSSVTWKGARVALSAPEGWIVESTGRVGFGSLAPGESGTATFRVTAPSDTSGTVRLIAEANANTGRAPLSFRREHDVTPAPPAPSSSAYLSDLEWASATNGWGPVERDTSNGKKPAGDGTPISFGGVTYAKGLGVHARSEVVYYLGAKASRLTAVVGIDDFSADQSSKGHTIAEVWGDGRLLHATGGLRAATGPEEVDVDLNGVEVLTLIVRAADSNTSYNHTSWADAYLHI